MFKNEFDDIYNTIQSNDFNFEQIEDYKNQLKFKAITDKEIKIGIENHQEIQEINLCKNCFKHTLEQDNSVWQNVNNRDLYGPKSFEFQEKTAYQILTSASAITKDKSNQGLTRMLLSWQHAETFFTPHLNSGLAYEDRTKKSSINGMIEAKVLSEMTYRLQDLQLFGVMNQLLIVFGICYTIVNKRSTDFALKFKCSLIAMILAQLCTQCCCVIYNKALSTTAGGTATVTSSTPFQTGYEPNWAIDGVVTFCNSGGTACPGPYLNKMFKSQNAMATNDVYLKIDMGSNQNIISLYMSLEESSTLQHVGMQVWIGSGTLVTSTLCYEVTSATYSRWVQCGTGIIGRYILITMPVVGKSLNIIEVMAYGFYFVQSSVMTVFAQEGSNLVRLQPVSGSNFTNCFKTENALQRGTETSCSTYYGLGTATNYLLILFSAHFKIAAVVTIPQISQLHPATSADYSSNMITFVRIGDQLFKTVQTSPKCSPTAISNPLSNPEFNCNNMLAWGVTLTRDSSGVFGICSVGILTDCKCDETSFASTIIHPSKYFNNALISPTSFGLLLYANLTAQTYVSSLTDSVSLICGDRSGKTWCGNRALVVWDVVSGTEYDITQPNSLFTYNSVTGVLGIQATQASQVGTHSFILKAKLASSPSLGYFPQSTAFTVSVSMGIYDQLALSLSVQNSDGQSFDNIKYQIINDGVKESEFFLMVPEQFQNIKFNPVFNLTSTSTSITKIYTDFKDFTACQNSNQTSCIFLEIKKQKISLLIKKQIPDFNLQLQTFVSDVNGVISSTSCVQNIIVTVTACSIETLTPVFPNLSYSYELNSGKQKFQLSDYIQQPQCNYQRIVMIANVIESLKQLIDPQIQGLQLEINANDTSIVNQTIILQITAEFQDGFINQDAEISFLITTSSLSRNSQFKNSTTKNQTDLTQIAKKNLSNTYYTPTNKTQVQKQKKPQIESISKLSIFEQSGGYVVQLASQATLSQMLALISSMSIIQHTFLISLTYPENLQEFWDIIQPIITIDIFQSEKLNKSIFNFDQIENQAPLSEQFGRVNYDSTFSIKNLGGIFWSSIFIPSIIALSSIPAYILSKFKTKKKFLQKVKTILDYVIQKIFFYTFITFISSNYLVIATVTLIQLQDIRIQNSYSWQERLVSSIGLLMIMPTFVFPFAIFIIYWMTIKRVKPLPDLKDDMDLEDLRYIYGTINIQQIQKTAYTSSKHKKFMLRFGALLEDQNFEKNGTKLSIVFAVFTFARLFVMTLVLVNCLEYPIIQLLIIVYLQIIVLQIELHYLPLKDNLKQSNTLFCEIGHMIINYHIMLFTEFTESEWRSQLGVSVDAFTIIISAYTFYSSYKPWVHFLQKRYKKYRLIKQNQQKLNRRNKAKQFFVDKANTQIAASKEQQEQRAPFTIENVLLKFNRRKRITEPVQEQQKQKITLQNTQLWIDDTVLDEFQVNDSKTLMKTQSLLVQQALELEEIEECSERSKDKSYATFREENITHGRKLPQVLEVVQQQSVRSTYLKTNQLVQDEELQSYTSSLDNS